jgi:hypothetical protein
MRLRRQANGLALLCAASAGPAAAISVNQAAVALTFIAAFAVFALLLLLVVLALVALASKQPQRRALVRKALVRFCAASAAAAAFLAVLRQMRQYASFDVAVMCCAAALIAVAIALVIHAYVASRRALPQA